ncbi:MAG: hypothetical protein U1E29_11275, partial [Coriobacteriia bacterium]|nr:hypothetical protein [Coriobacteriia bacterium]
PFVTALADSGDAYTLVDLRTEKSVREQFGSAYPMTSLVVRQDVIDDDPETVQRVTTALVKACRWLQTATPEDVTKLLPVDYVPEPDLWAKSFANSREVFSPDGAIDPEGIKTVIAAQIAFGTLKSVAEVQIESLYTIRFLEAQPVVVPSASPSQAKVPAPKAEETSRRWILAGLAVVLVIVLVSISKAGSKKGQIK